MENLKVSIGGALERALSFSKAFERIGAVTLFLLLFFYPFFFSIHEQKVFGNLTYILIISHSLFAGTAKEVESGVFVNIREGHLSFLVNTLF